MTDLVAQLVGALGKFVERFKEHEDAGPRGETWQSDEFLAELAEARAALSEAKAGGWVAVPDCPDGDVWFALSCGHVVMGYKQGDLILDWEAAVDHDCCYDASAIKAMPVVPPNPPKGEV